MTKPAPLLSLTTRATLFANLAALEKAGVPVERAFATLSLPPAEQPRLLTMRQQLAQGRDLALAGQKAGLFTVLEVTLLQAATSSGSPAFVYQRLAERYAHKARHLKAMKSRLLMPLAVFVIALLVQPLPGLVSGAVGIGGYLGRSIGPLVLLAILLMLGRHLLLRLENSRPGAGRHDLDGLLLAIPLFGVAHARRNARDYFESLGLMLEAGLPMFEALPKAGATLGNSLLRERFAGLQQRVLDGEPLAQAILPLDFPGKPMLASLIRTGEASGTLPATLLGYARRETQSLDDFQEQLAIWLPRLVYAGLVVWMASGLISGGGFPPEIAARLG